MCLLKVYLDKGGDRRLIAENVALIMKEGGSFKLLDLEMREEAMLEEVDVSLIDTLNAVMILKPKKLKK